MSRPLLFQHTWKNVIRGKKTQTRRLVKSDDYLEDGVVYRLVGNRTDSPQYHRYWSVGDVCAVKTHMYRKAVAYVRFTNIRREFIVDISEEDAFAEGFKNQQAFWQLWRQMYGHIKGECWVLEFKFERLTGYVPDGVTHLQLNKLSGLSLGEAAT